MTHRSSQWGACVDQFVLRECDLAQNRDHGRLTWQLHGLRPAMAETLAALGDANQVTESEVPTHLRQHLERKVVQMDATKRHDTKDGSTPNLFQDRIFLSLQGSKDATTHTTDTPACAATAQYTIFIQLLKVAHLL
jgi:hypothetical protein